MRLTRVSKSPSGFADHTGLAAVVIRNLAVVSDYCVGILLSVEIILVSSVLRDARLSEGPISVPSKHQ